jgi:hypothetical protein
MKQYDAYDENDAYYDDVECGDDCDGYGVLL